MANPRKSHSVEQGAVVYSSWFLAFYDFLILGVMNNYTWRCSTEKYLLPLFRQNVRSNHLDIGVGSGYYLEHAKISKEVSVTLCDLNPAALATASARCAKFGPQPTTMLHDITQPLSAVTEDHFDSVSMFYLLHCLPGPIERKTGVIKNVAKSMTPDGVLSGATVLSNKSVKDNWIAMAWRWYTQRGGYLDTRDDHEESYVNALEETFEQVETKVVGAALLFRAERLREKQTWAMPGSTD